MPLVFRFQTNFATKLQADIGAGALSFTLTTVPDGLPVGRYSFKIGTSQFTAEWLSAEYPGSGTTFTSAERVGEGGNPPRAWPAGTSVAHVLTGEAFESLRAATTAAASPSTHPELYVRPAGVRLSLSQNCT